MKNKKPAFKLRLNNACDASWKSMQRTEVGGFCKHCEKEVIDMTLWTESDFISFFKSSSTPVCGRILPQYLNHHFHEKPTKSLQSRWSWKAIAVSFISLVTWPVSAITKPSHHTEQSVLLDQQDILSSSGEEVLIQGTVTGPDHAILRDVQIDFLGKKYQTDLNGHFEIRLEASEVKSGILVLNYGKLKQEVRNYHVAMGNITYQITMSEPDSGYPVLMGGISAFYNSPYDGPTLVEIKTSTLSLSNKKQLDSLASFIRKNPNEQFELQTYYNSNHKQALALGFLIVHYLEDKQGIDKEHFRVIEPIRTKQNKLIRQVKILQILD